MFDVSTLGTYIAVVIGLFLIPGPAVFLIIARTAQGGRQVGIMTALGISSGDFIHTLFAAVGLSALLMTSALAFNIVKYAGAAYLIYLGIRAIMDKQTSDSSKLKTSIISPPKAFFQAIMTEVLNPKTALFFLAFLPQFVHPQQGSSFIQFMVLGLIFVVLSVVFTVMLVLVIKPLGILIKKMTWLKRQQGKIIGTIFISLGLKVVMQQR